MDQSERRTLLDLLGGDQIADLMALGAELRERLIVYGTLSEPPSGEAVGVALALQAPDMNTAVALLRDGGSGLDAFPSIEVHDWEFGGRR